MLPLRMSKSYQFPTGPHFSTIFYTSVLGLASTAFSLVGMFVYTRFMKTWRYPKVLIFGNVLAGGVGLVSCFAHLLDSHRDASPHLFVIGLFLGWDSEANFLVFVCNFVRLVGAVRYSWDLPRSSSLIESGPKEVDKKRRSEEANISIMICWIRQALGNNLCELGYMLDAL